MMTSSQHMFITRLKPLVFDKMGGSIACRFCLIDWLNLTVDLPSLCCYG
ncbi:hypothetical protein LU293_04040 [Moraxella nasovis]|nr:hypothetical protein [Moraxella nasovis]UNU74072.1 hypothetical protein LU293_04040 [Moraxella nasovis]